MHPLVAALPPDSWFRKWMEVWPLSEPPKSYILCAAMSMLSATLGRSIWFEDDERKLPVKVEEKDHRDRCRECSSDQLNQARADEVPEAVGVVHHPR